MKAVIAVAAAIAFVAGRAQAANQDPPLSDTLTWLRDAIQAHANNGGAAGAACDGNRQNRPCRFKYTPVDFTSCSITYEFEGQITMGDQARTRKAKVVVPLWELATPLARREQEDVSNWMVPLSLRENARYPIRIEEDADPTYLPGSRAYEQRLVWLEFGDVDTDNQAMAQRVAKAFARAIELCGGYNAKGAEPF
jgi:hypothetical protein